MAPPQTCSQANILGGSHIHHFHLQGSNHMGSFPYLGIEASLEVGTPAVVELVPPPAVAPPAVAPPSRYTFQCSFILILVSLRPFESEGREELS